MKRGEVWTASGEGDYAGKPRLVVIVQDDRFDATLSVTVCPLTTVPSDASLARPLVAPTGGNGLVSASYLMCDKITTLRRRRLGRMVGRLTDEELVRLNRAMLVFLGLAG
jgi:mRNA interferase MazF